MFVLSFPVTSFTIIKHPIAFSGASVNFICPQSCLCHTCCPGFSVTSLFTAYFSVCELIGLSVIFLAIVHVRLLQLRSMDCFSSSFFIAIFIKSRPSLRPIILAEILALCVDRQALFLMLYLPLLSSNKFGNETLYFYSF